MKKKILVISVAIFSILVGIVFLRNEFIYEPFDSTKWKNWQESEASPSERWEMIASLKKDQTLIGKTKREIIDLLGKPDKNQNNIYVYYLGYTQKGINTGNLEVFFNEQNIVSDFKITNG